jgi:alpha-glucosidase (family GH31 glycosyl hydrolase)
MRSAMQLRIKILPYLYTSARHTYDTGLSVCLPLYYDYPTEENAYTFQTQYLFGRDIMVAPVVSAGSTDSQLVENMKVWIPPGEWVEAWSGRVFNGPTVMKRSFALQEIPYYVRSGAIIVNRLLGPDEEKNWGGWLGKAKEIPDGLEVNVYVPSDVEKEVQGETFHYEDEGTNINYQTGKYAWRFGHFAL